MHWTVNYMHKQQVRAQWYDKSAVMNRLFGYFCLTVFVFVAGHFTECASTMPSLPKSVGRLLLLMHFDDTRVLVQILIAFAYYWLPREAFVVESHTG